MLSDYIISVRIQLMDYQEKLYCKGNVIHVLEPKKDTPMCHNSYTCIMLLDWYCQSSLQCTFGPEFPDFFSQYHKAFIDREFRISLDTH